MAKVPPSRSPYLLPGGCDSRSWADPPPSTSGDSSVCDEEKLLSDSCSKNPLKRLMFSLDVKEFVDIYLKFYANRAAKPEFT